MATRAETSETPGASQARVGGKSIPEGLQTKPIQVLSSELEPVLKFLDVQTQSGRGGDRDRARAWVGKAQLRNAHPAEAIT